MKPMQNVKIHKPVLANEVIVAFNLESGAPLNYQSRYIDATCGSGGHTLALVKYGGKILGIDSDLSALKVAENVLKKACPTPENIQTYNFVHGNFINIDKIARKFGFTDVDGVLFDLGVSTPQLTSNFRGMSFGAKDAQLDMRIDPTTQSIKAFDLLNILRKDQLLDLFSVVYSKPMAKRIALNIANFREEKPFLTVGDFLKALRFLPKKGMLHPATKAFLALRVAVNSELENLKTALPKAFNLLKKGGRLIVISYHSGEDTLVKRFLLREETEKNGLIISKKPIVASNEEIEINPSARSAKMRVLEKS